MQRPIGIMEQPKPINFGPYTLQTFPQKHFRTSMSLTEPQQCILDNLWHFRNHKSFPDILQILAGHFAFLNSPNQAQASSSQQQFYPHSVSALESQVKELKISLAHKEKEKQTCSEELVTMAKKILDDEKAERERKWESFPTPLHPLKGHILKFVLADRMAEALALQEYFRKICTRPVPLHDGLTFSIISHKGFTHPEKSFTFVSAVINLRKWTDKNILGLNLSVENLWRYGMISKLYLFDIVYPEQRYVLKDRQLAHICDHLAETGKVLNGYIRLDVKSVPPSFNPQYPDDCRQEVLVSGISAGKPWIYYNFHDFTIIPESKIPVLNQMMNYRSMRISGMEHSSFGTVHRLLAESRNQKIFWNTLTTVHIHVPFQSLFPEDPALVDYYSSPHNKNLITIHGEFPSHGDDHFDPYDDGDDDLDDEHGNLANAFEA